MYITNYKYLTFIHSVALLQFFLIKKGSAKKKMAKIFTILKIENLKSLRFYPMYIYNLNNNKILLSY